MMTSANVSRLWNGSWHSVADRVTSSGFLPTSVSGGYGGITQQFVRDACGQLIGLLQLGQQFYPKVRSRIKDLLLDVSALYAVVQVKQALEFMLGQLTLSYKAGTYNEYAPHVMHANKALDRIERYVPTNIGTAKILIFSLSLS